MQWQRFDQPGYGCSIEVPQGWDERPPNLRNFVVRDDVHFVLGCGTSVPEEDRELFAGIVERFEIWAEDERPEA
ncbi:hypothetical protein [Nonomuraea insulae]|uniref:Immunity protein 53 of polymorphic toxin system n=1 Tax=Nonomuraea insulae TaxID=1616787 RepID=A0ABW1D0Y1_9ACTN